MPGYEVRPLDEDAAARLVAARFPGLAPAVRQRIVAEAQGNPLALLELPAGLSDRQRAALAPLPAVLPLSGRLQGAAVVAGLRPCPRPPATCCCWPCWRARETSRLLRAAAARQCEVDDLAPRRAGGPGARGRSGPAGRLRAPRRSGRPCSNGRRAARCAGRTWRWPRSSAISPSGGHGIWPGLPSRPDGQRPARCAGAAPARDRGDAGQARRLATAAYLAASVAGDLGAAEALLADARRACPAPRRRPRPRSRPPSCCCTGTGTWRPRTACCCAGWRPPRDGGAGPLGAEEALWILVTVCRLSGRAEHWESLERSSPSPVSVRRTCALPSAALDPRPVPGGLDRGPLA